MRQLLLYFVIFSLSLSALVAIFAFLIGDFGDTETRIVLTTLAIGAFSLSGLCCSGLYDQKKNLPVAFLGLLSSAIALLISLITIWELIDFTDIWRVLSVAIIFAVSTAHSALLLSARPGQKIVQTSTRITSAFIAIVALMLIVVVIWGDNELGDFFYRLLGVFAVLDVLGTVVTPLLRKFAPSAPASS